MTTFRDGLLAGKVAFVAGGTSGINLGIAKRLAELGAKVAVCGRDAEKAARAAGEIGGDALGLSADVRDYGAIRAALEQTAGDFGLLDIVIAGAAGNFLAPALGMSANAFKTVVDIDLLGTFNTLRACHDLLNKPGASLIAITAGQADQAMALQIHACAAKAGVNQVVRTLAIEWGPDVRVNGISPGPIAGTEGMERLSPNPGMKEASESRIPMKRWGEIGEIADAAAFLCSPAASYITGAILDVDGGSSVGDAGRMDLARGLG
ncbi:SDR family oxidoreductase [Altererythrobacter sp. TH136]|uniref:SDR family oxidoreductase n=1 Tax=Altererythrobacter sp. TH136 TaxID=2067415 RepID=UPI0011623520|nr:SDR family oxidoreductase [Altererythrobacter sp. TH136]QDM41328.1 SDR family oxidoreductase [Altererythrobacter sp. TH136]